MVKENYNAIVLRVLIDESTDKHYRKEIKKLEHAKNLRYILKNINKLIINEDNYQNIINIIKSEKLSNYNIISKINYLLTVMN